MQIISEKEDVNVSLQTLLSLVTLALYYLSMGVVQIDVLEHAVIGQCPTAPDRMSKDVTQRAPKVNLASSFISIPKDILGTLVPFSDVRCLRSKKRNFIDIHITYKKKAVVA